MIRSAKTKAITPPKLMPPFQSTAASGTLPTEHTKLSREITGPIKGPQTWERTGWPVKKKLCPLRSSEREMATAAYEHDDEAAPNSVARPRLRGESEPSARTTAWRETSVWTIAERMNPSARGQKTSHNMSKAVASALRTAA